jgi:4-amino-4-deoxy-L-arabinose transferase-like glycosyltransferase
MADKPKKKKKRESPAPAATFDIFGRPDSWSRTDTRNVILVAAAALSIRLVFYFLNKENNPLFYYPIMDGKYHYEWAQEILAGNFWGNEVFFRAPLYPYFLAFLYKISGSSIGFVILFQHLIGVATTTLVYLLSRRFFRARVALLSGMIAAFYWPFLYFEADLLIVTLVVFLDLLALLLLTLALQDRLASPDRTGIRDRRVRRSLLFVGAGFVLGISAVARPSVLIFLPVLPVIFYLSVPRSSRSTHRNGRWIRQTLLVYAATAAVILPVGIRNFVVGRDIVPIASQGGINFYIGNNPQSDGRTAIVPGTRWDWWGGYEDAIRIAETDMGKKLKPSEVSNYYLRKGLDFVFTSPGESIPLLGKKLYLFWAGGERSNNKYIYFFWHQSGMGHVPLPGFWLVASLGLFGGVLLWRKGPGIRILHGFVLSYMIGVVAFFVNARFRLPVVPVLIVFASYGVFYLIDLWQRRRGSAAWKPLLLLAVCVLAVNYDFIHFQENKVDEDSLSHYTLGNAYLSRGDTENAIREYEEARDTYARYPRPGYLLVARNVDYNLGRLYWANDRCPEAVERLGTVGGSDQYAVLALELLADCYVKLEQFDNAIEAYRTILIGVPTHRKAIIGLVRAYRHGGYPERAEELLRSVISQTTGQDAEAHFELALTLEDLDRPEEAMDSYLVASGSPAYRGHSYVGLAALYEKTGDPKNALDYYQRAAALLPDDASIRARIESLEAGK